MKGIFESLRKTRNAVFGQIMNILGTGEIDDDTWEDLEAVLIQGDVGVETTLKLVQNLRAQVEEQGLYRKKDLQACAAGCAFTAFAGSRTPEPGLAPGGDPGCGCEWVR